MRGWNVWRDGNVVVIDDPIGVWLMQSDPDKDIGLTWFGYNDDGHPIQVSTIFLDHGWHDGSPAPKLWETMVFGLSEGHRLHGLTEQYTSREQAEAGHAEVCSALAGMLNRIGEPIDRKNPPWRQAENESPSFG